MFIYIFVYTFKHTYIYIYTLYPSIVAHHVCPCWLSAAHAGCAQQVPGWRRRTQGLPGMEAC